MKHQMKLANKPFESIKNKTKTIEMRLNDEKRRLINIGDYIEFLNIETAQKIVVKVINLYRFNDFEKVYKNFDKKKLGYEVNEQASYVDMYNYYDEMKIKKYGVLAIEIELINICR